MLHVLVLYYFYSCRELQFRINFPLRANVFFSAIVFILWSAFFWIQYPLLLLCQALYWKGTRKKTQVRWIALISGAIIYEKNKKKFLSPTPPTFLAFFANFIDFSRDELFIKKPFSLGQEDRASKTARYNVQIHGKFT